MNKQNDKLLMSINETAKWSGLGKETIRKLSCQPDCNFTLIVGNRTYIKKEQFKKFIDNTKYI